MKFLIEDNFNNHYLLSMWIVVNVKSAGAGAKFLLEA